MPATPAYLRRMEISLKVSLFFAAMLCIGTAIWLEVRPLAQGEPRSRKWSVAALLLAGLLLRILCAADPFLHEWDERYHALVAKNIAQGGQWLLPTLYADAPLDFDYRNWFAVHIWLHKQPLPTWCMAGAIQIFGVSEWAVRLPSLLLSTAAIYLTFLLGKRLFSAQIGFWAAFFHAVNGLIIAISTGRAPTDHVDGFFLFFVEWAVVLAAQYCGRDDAPNAPRRRLNAMAVGAVMGAAILCKWLPALIVVPIYWLLNGALHSFSNQTPRRPIWHPVGETLLLLAAATLVALPWQVYAATAFPKPFWIEQQHHWLHIRSVLDGHAEPWWFYFAQAGRVWGELIYLPLGWLLWQLRNRDLRYLALAVWIFVPYLFFTFVQTKMTGYVLFCGPAVFLCEALFLVHFSSESRLSRFLKPGKSGSAVLAQTLWVACVVLALRYGIERVKPFRSTAPERAMREQICALQSYAEGRKKVALLNTQRCIEVMFYTDLLAYFRMPSQEEIQQLHSGGWRVLVADSPEVPEWLRTDQRVEIIRF